jgi:hypothetical protein
LLGVPQRVELITVPLAAVVFIHIATMNISLRKKASPEEIFCTERAIIAAATALS